MFIEVNACQIKQHKRAQHLLFTGIIRFIFCVFYYNLIVSFHNVLWIEIQNIFSNSFYTVKLFKFRNLLNAFYRTECF